MKTSIWVRARGLVGLCALAYALIDGAISLELVLTGEPRAGSVTRIWPRGSLIGSTRLAYRTAEEPPAEASVSVRGLFRRYEGGERVQVLTLVRSEGETARIDSFGELWLVPLVSGLAGASLAWRELVGLLFAGVLLFSRDGLAGNNSRNPLRRMGVVLRLGMACAHLRRLDDLRARALIPDVIVLVADDDPDPAREMNAPIAELERFGFTRAGRYVIQDLKGFRFQLLHHPQEHLLGIITYVDLGGFVATSLARLLTSGEWIVCSNGPFHETVERPHLRGFHDADWTVEDMWFRILGEPGRRELRDVESSEWPSLVEAMMEAELGRLRERNAELLKPRDLYGAMTSAGSPKR